MGQPAPPPGDGVLRRCFVTQDLEFYLNSAAFFRWWLSTWRIPLQVRYDEEEAQAYFARRPHLLLFRLAQVSAAMVSIGYSFLRDSQAGRTGGGGTALEGDRIKEMEKRRMATAFKLKDILINLGPTFIKVAQSLSARPDVIGPDTAAVLTELQDRLPPFDTDEALEIVAAELKRPIASLFAELSPIPVAAASFGQVYRGLTVDGREVAVKVQRPRVLLAVARDILILRILLGVVKRVARINSDLRILADELGRGLYGELDYRLEAANAAAFAAAHTHLQYVQVPKVYPEMTTRKVLVMEWINGERPSDLLAIAQGKVPMAPVWQRELAMQKLLRLIAIGVESSLVQLLDTGVMHADPHPGNLLLTQEGRVAYLDFGLLTRMEPQHQAAFLAAIAHLVNAEWAALADDLADMDVLKPTTDRAAVTRALEEAFGAGTSAVVQTGLPDIKFGQVSTQLWRIALRFRFKLPPYYTLVLRSLASLEGIGIAVDPAFKVFASAYPYVVRRLLTDNHPSSRAVLRQLLLKEDKRFRWDRMAAIGESTMKASRAREEALVPLPLDGAAGPLRGAKDVPSEWKKAELRSSGVGGSSVTVASVMGLILSREAASTRRLLLDADAGSIAQAFVSREASAVRRRLARALAEMALVKMQPVLEAVALPPSYAAPSQLALMQDEANIVARSPTSRPPSPLPPLSSSSAWSQAQELVFDDTEDIPSSLSSARSQSFFPNSQGISNGRVLPTSLATSQSTAARHVDNRVQVSQWHPLALPATAPVGETYTSAAAAAPSSSVATETTADRIQNKRLWFLVRVALTRLDSCSLVLKVRVSWTAFTIFCTVVWIVFMGIVRKFRGTAQQWLVWIGSVGLSRLPQAVQMQARDRRAVQELASRAKLDFSSAAQQRTEEAGHLAARVGEVIQLTLARLGEEEEAGRRLAKAVEEAEEALTVLGELVEEGRTLAQETLLQTRVMGQRAQDILATEARGGFRRTLRARLQVEGRMTRLRQLVAEGKDQVRSVVEQAKGGLSSEQRLGTLVGADWEVKRVVEAVAERAAHLASQARQEGPGGIRRRLRQVATKDFWQKVQLMATRLHSKVQYELGRRLVTLREQEAVGEAPFVEPGEPMPSVHPLQETVSRTPPPFSSSRKRVEALDPRGLLRAGLVLFLRAVKLVAVYANLMVVRALRYRKRVWEAHSWRLDGARASCGQLWRQARSVSSTLMDNRQIQEHFLAAANYAGRLLLVIWILLLKFATQRAVRLNEWLRQRHGGEGTDSSSSAAGGF
eukprot:TRINITY_DN16720_c0_g1_i1.p1 TRINITY_DN16720_c0_g1~~TRINITY_DN16720_c0_g1_i1.p1  ORF type:complete len:1485 (-),score=215.30 TRINITY_DN16720_c0_g1_i1:607-4422(-)